MGTDALAFRQIADRVAELGLRGAALDIGCGAGRSTRFLRHLGFQAVGVDVSEAMVFEARRRDPAGDFRVCPARLPLPFEDAWFDLVLSTWVVLEIDSRKDLERFMREIARVLRIGGVGFVVANTIEFYFGDWVSCEVAFPENRNPLRSGQLVKARLMPEGVVVTDTFWSDSDYIAAIEGAGLRIAHTWHPLAPATENCWLDETKTAPWVVYEVNRTQQVASQPG